MYWPSLPEAPTMQTFITRILPSNSAKLRLSVFLRPCAQPLGALRAERHGKQGTNVLKGPDPADRRAVTRRPSTRYRH
jgi:hypothetical protein